MHPDNYSHFGIISFPYVQEYNATEITSLSQLDHKISENESKATKQWWI
jgi:hypothetical protein